MLSRIVAIAQKHKGAVLTAIDLSPGALAVARRNADRHKLGDRIRVRAERIDPIRRRVEFALVSSLPNISRTKSPSSRPKQPDIFLRAALWRVGRRSRGTVGTSKVLPRSMRPAKTRAPLRFLIAGRCVEQPQIH